MALPIFFHNAVLQRGKELWLGEDTARHVVQVLRMSTGEELQLTDGKGHAATASIVRADKKKCLVRLDDVTFHAAPAVALHLAIAFTKNTSRNEWLLEKAAELGVRSIIPLSATRSERERIRYDRWQNILVSALLQSQQYHLPVLNEAMTLQAITVQYENVEQKLIGHCIEEFDRRPIREMLKPGKETIVLIGPEGDFTEEEVNLCLKAHYEGISMGIQRLRTETAAMAVCAYFNLVNHVAI
ncbi:MAG: 16S rRNA (uracil(1498)-N(3))-methyltransferase [Bacteroidetes bacterium]|nr:16S rRNA (uracil(1498)-N(3))-methyltransferase [Bacteroidota bacterium]